VQAVQVKLRRALRALVQRLRALLDFSPCTAIVVRAF
jgi:hypothetical protein